MCSKTTEATMIDHMHFLLFFVKRSLLLYRCISLLGAGLLPVEILVHAPNNVKICYVV